MVRRPRKPNTVFKKRRNVGVPKDRLGLNTPQQSSVSNLGLTQNRPTGNPAPTTPGSRTSSQISTSEKKIGNLDSLYSNFSCNDSVNIVLDLVLLNDALAQSVICSNCGESEIQMNLVSSIGLASNLEICCKNCTKKHSFMSSNKLKDSPKLYDHNVRLVYGLRSIGKGQKAAETLCGLMNLPSPPTHFEPYVNVLGSAAEDVCFESMKDAVEEAILINDGNRDLPVAIDGTWQKRGHTSLNGVITATSFDTGKVIDVSILSKYCKCPHKENHSSSCTANYRGSSGGMEVQGAVEIFQRSLSSYNVRYTQYLGDGDSKGFIAVQDLKPYGPECKINKLECLGHIQKRMGTRLRKIKNENKHVKFADGKGLGGKNRLSQANIDKLQNYYGTAIRRNTHSVDSMVKDIWALYFHKLSTDDDPHHGLCPIGEKSWCGYQKAVAEKSTYTHKNSIPKPIMEFIKPVFRSLADKELLKKCLHGKTQNPNESVNAVIWSRLPKTGFVGIKTLHFGVYDAVSSFNSGNVSKCKVLSKLCLNIGKHTICSMKKIDERRIRDSKRNSSEIKKQARQKKRQVKRRLEDQEENPDEPSYAPGGF